MPSASATQRKPKSRARRGRRHRERSTAPRRRIRGRTRSRRRCSPPAWLRCSSPAATPMTGDHDRSRARPSTSPSADRGRRRPDRPRHPSERWSAPAPGGRRARGGDVASPRVSSRRRDSLDIPSPGLRARRSSSEAAIRRATSSARLEIVRTPGDRRPVARGSGPARFPPRGRPRRPRRGCRRRGSPRRGGTPASASACSKIAGEGLRAPTPAEVTMPSSSGASPSARARRPARRPSC